MKNLSENYLTDIFFYGTINSVIWRNACDGKNMAGVVKWLTRRIVAPLRVGSSPTTRPIFFCLNPILSDFMGASPSGKATDFDSVIGGSTLPAPARKQK